MQQQFDVIIARTACLIAGVIAGYIIYWCGLRQVPQFERAVALTSIAFGAIAGFGLLLKFNRHLQRLSAGIHT